MDKFYGIRGKRIKSSTIERNKTSNAGLLDVDEILESQIADNEINMGNTANSNNQSGGITAVNVNIGSDGGSSGTDSKRMWKTIGKIALVIGLISSTVTVLGYFGFKPGGWFMKDDKTVSVTSYKQSGGITAGTVNIGKPDRQLTPQFIAQLQSVLPKDGDLRTIVIKPTHQDAETLRFSEKLKDHLLSLGYKAELLNGIISFAKQDWPADVNVISDADGKLKEIIVTPIK